MIRRFSGSLHQLLLSRKQTNIGALGVNYPSGRTLPLWYPSMFYFSDFPKHQIIKVPSFSPTMTEGKIVKWYKNVGDKLEEGDVLCDVEGDKATSSYEVLQGGFLAKRNEATGFIPIGASMAAVVSTKDQVKGFENFKFDDEGGSNKKPAEQPKKVEPAEKPKKVQQKQPEKAKQAPQPQQKHSSQTTVFASPAAKNLAATKGIDLGSVGQGSGLNKRIIKQDVQNFAEKPVQPPKTAEKPSEQPKKKQGKKQLYIPENQYHEIPLTGMRKTIAARLTQAKQTIPHYYITLDVEMDKIGKIRNQLNLNQKQNGVKISINDIIIKAMALAMRDNPSINAQWMGHSIRQYKYADVSVAVATEGGLITPIVFRADTLGLIEIAKKTKDLSKRARQGKLDPREFAGGTTTISNLGMYGINSVISVINPPQSTILGVGKTQKRIIFDKLSTNPQKPYRVAEVLQFVVSADHRVIDGATLAKWVTKIKRYLENPNEMLL